MCCRCSRQRCSQPGSLCRSCRGRAHAVAAVRTHVQYLFLAVLVGADGRGNQWVVGRGRPSVGGKADPFKLRAFNGTGPI